MSKFVIISLLAVLAVANARSHNVDVSNINHNEVAPLQKEERLLLEVPAVSTIILKSLKAVWFVLKTVCSIIDFKLAAVALAINAVVWLLSFKFPIVLGAAVVLGFCKLTGLCSYDHGLFKSNHLDYAADHLDMGTLKYGVSS